MPQKYFESKPYLQNYNQNCGISEEDLADHLSSKALTAKLAAKELETLQVPDLPEEYTVTGTFSDKYKKPEGRETEVRLHSKAPSPNPDVVVRARLTGAGAGLPFPSVCFPSILFGVA